MKSQKQTIATKDATFSKQMAKTMMPFAECYAAFLESRDIKAAEQYIEAYGDASDRMVIAFVRFNSDVETFHRALKESVEAHFNVVRMGPSLVQDQYYIGVDIISPYFLLMPNMPKQQMCAVKLRDFLNEWNNHGLHMFRLVRVTPYEKNKLLVRIPGGQDVFNTLIKELLCGGYVICGGTANFSDFGYEQRIVVSCDSPAFVTINQSTPSTEAQND